MVNPKITGMAIVMAAVLLLPLATPFAQAQVATGSATIQSTCGLLLNNTSFAFGTLARDATSPIDGERIEFSNDGSVVADVDVYADNWESGGTVHIGGELTKYSRSNQGTDGEGVSYGSKIALNSTVTETETFGTIDPLPSVNNTSWQLLATLQNLPFSGALSQTITFTATCL